MGGSAYTRPPLQALALGPGGRWVYAAEWESRIVTYAVEDDGRVAKVGETSAPGGTTGALLRRAGRLYAVNSDGPWSTLAAYAIDPVSGLPGVRGIAPLGLDHPASGALEPAARRLFASGGNGIAVVDADTLSELDVAAGAPRAERMVVDPSGRFLYVSRRDTNQVSGYAIGEDGRLMPLPAFGPGGGDIVVVRRP